MTGKFCWLLLFSSALYANVVGARSYDDVIESGYIDIAVYQQFAPYSYKNAEGKPTGIDVELAKLIAAKLGVKVKWLWLASDETVEDDLRNAIWKGRKIDRRKADLMMRAPFDSKFSYGVDGYGLPRNELVVMFSPYHTEKWSIARDLKKVGTERNLAIFRFEKIGVEIDTLPDTFLLSAHGGVFRENVVHFRELGDAGQALVDGELAAILGMHSQVLWALGENAKKYDIDDDGLGAMAKSTWDLGIAVSHEFRQLSYKVAEIVEVAINDKTLEKIFSNYGLEYVTPDYYQ